MIELVQISRHRSFKRRSELEPGPCLDLLKDSFSKSVHQILSNQPVVSSFLRERKSSVFEIGNLLPVGRLAPLVFLFIRTNDLVLVICVPPVDVVIEVKDASVN